MTGLPAAFEHHRTVFAAIGDFMDAEVKPGGE